MANQAGFTNVFFAIRHSPKQVTKGPSIIYFQINFIFLSVGYFARQLAMYKGTKYAAHIGLLVAIIVLLVTHIVFNSYAPAREYSQKHSLQWLYSWGMPSIVLGLVLAFTITELREPE